MTRDELIGVLNDAGASDDEVVIAVGGSMLGLHVASVCEREAMDGRRVVQLAASPVRPEPLVSE